MSSQSPPQSPTPTANSRTKPAPRLSKHTSSGGETPDPANGGRPQLHHVMSNPLDASSGGTVDHDDDLPVRASSNTIVGNNPSGGGFFGRILKGNQAQKKKSPEVKRASGSAVVRGADDQGRSRGDSKHSRSRSSHAQPPISAFHAFSLDDEKKPGVEKQLSNPFTPLMPRINSENSSSPHHTNTYDNEELSASYSMGEKASSGLSGVSSAILMLSTLMEEEKECWHHYPRVKETVLNAILVLKQTREEHRVDELEKSLLLNVIDSTQIHPESAVSKWISTDFAPSNARDMKKKGFGNQVIRSYSTPIVDSDSLFEKLQSGVPAAEGGKMRTRASSMEKIMESRLLPKVGNIDVVESLGHDHKVRIGAFVTSYDVLGLLLKSAQWDFDIFALNEISNGTPLTTLMMYIFHCLNFQGKFQIDEKVFQNFVSIVETGYLANPYHNAVHAADVVQCLLHIITSSDITKYITNTDMFAALIAGAVHDLGHRGKTNQYEIETGSGLAIRYNDQSVLENHHIASAFRIMEVSSIFEVRNVLNFYVVARECRHTG
jgi:hypothetical protein